MTIASSSTVELTVDQIVLQAFRLASVMPLEQGASGIQWERRASAARLYLETIVKGLEAEGRLAKGRKYYTFPLVTGQNDYTMPAAVMDVYGVAEYIPAGQDPTAATTEIQVNQISMETWQTLGNRTLETIPSMYWCDRQGASVVLHIWPKPSEAGSLRVQAYYLLANVTEGQSTVELERHWTAYLVNALAAYLAEATGQDDGKILRLQGMSAQLLLKAKGYSRERTGFRFVVNHRGPWSGRRSYR